MHNLYGSRIEEMWVASERTTKRTEKLQLMLNDEELRAIDDWRFANRIPSRAAALRELVRRGLKAVEQEEPPHNEPTGTYGVLDDTT